MRQRQDLHRSQYLACILISFEELQNGGSRGRERERETEERK
jgi:hypothetical protein